MFFQRRKYLCVHIFLACTIVGYLLSAAIAKAEEGGRHEVVLVDFETRIPCMHDGDVVGFRKYDKPHCRIIQNGAEGTTGSGEFTIGPRYRDIFLQGKVRRMYLATKSSKYLDQGPNALSFWVKLPAESSLLSSVRPIKVKGKVVGRRGGNKNTLGVWTYHWRHGDMGVGGKRNDSLATDSMMHAYSNFRFREEAAGRWINVVLTPSAFQQSRNYFHFYAARGTTDDLSFFPSLRQLQFRIFPKLEKEEVFQIDQIKLIYREPTAIFEKDFFEGSISRHVRDYSLPVTLKNPTKKDRKYRVFISSILGVEREIMNQAVSQTDSLKPARKIQAAVGGDGGIGVVELSSEKKTSLMRKELFIPAGGSWRGKLIHHIKPKMLGKQKIVKYGDFEFYARRDTLTTSVIVWDPYDESSSEMDYIEVNPDNSDDGKHSGPPGFPKQRRPPKGWRSEDIPLKQVGGYLVSVLHLE